LTWLRSLPRLFGGSAGSAIWTTLRSLGPSRGEGPSAWRTKIETSPVAEKSIEAGSIEAPTVAVTPGYP